MKTILFLIALVWTQVLTAQTLTNNEKAIQIIDKAIEVLGKCPDGLTVSGSGVIRNLGHYSSPEKTINIPVQETLAFFPDLQLAYSHTLIQPENGKFYSDFVSKKDSVYSWSYYDETFSKSKTYDGLIDVAKTNPCWLLYFAQKEALSLRVLENPGSNYLIAATMPDGQVYSLFIDKESHLIDRIERLVYNPIYGDAVFATVYKDYKKQEEFLMPQKRVDYQFGLVEREITYDSLSFATVPDTSVNFLNWLPEPYLQSLIKDETKEERVIFEKLSEKIDLIKYESKNIKSLLVKFPEGLGLFETPQGIPLNTLLLKEIKARYPNEKIRYLFLTHHHPDHAGGLKTYAGSDITVITTEGNTDYFNKLIRMPHNSLAEKMSNEIQLSFDYVPLDGQKDYEDIVTAFEIGKDTGHTDEHLVYYFPSERFLWTGDLLFFYEDERVYAAGDRGGSVYKLITRENLDVSRIYTSWPLQGQKEYGTVEFLKELVGND
jgi:hypothetical protein